MAKSVITINASNSRSATQDRAERNGTRAPKFVIQSEDKKYTFRFPYGPQQFSMTGIGPNYTTINRPGRHPLLLRSDQNLYVVTMTLQLASKDPQKSVEPWIDALQTLANQDTRVVVKYGLMNGYWWITDLSVSGTQRNLKNQVSRATSDVEFTRAYLLDNFGPVSGGVKPPPTKSRGKSPKPRASQARASKSATKYTVRKGDSLWAIAQKHYGDPQKWKLVADYNRLQSTTIYPGEKLLLP